MSKFFKSITPEKYYRFVLIAIVLLLFSYTIAQSLEAVGRLVTAGQLSYPFGIDTLLLFIGAMGLAVSVSMFLYGIGLGITMLNRYPQQRKTIFIYFVINIVILLLLFIYATSFSLGPAFVSRVSAQVFTFDRDLLNLGKFAPQHLQPFGQIKAASTWAFLDQADPQLTKVTIGIIDTGFDISHPEFAGVDPGNTPPDAKTNLLAPHGTKVAGLIGANNISATSPANYKFPHTNGIISGVKNLPYVLEVRRPTGLRLTLDTEQGFFYTADLILEANSVAKAGAKIINISLAPLTRLECGASDLLFLFFDALFRFRSNVIFVLAAGNGGFNAEICTPASLGFRDNVVTVGAVELNDKRAIFHLQL